jgi:hypothetical protein
MHHNTPLIELPYVDPDVVAALKRCYPNEIPPAPTTECQLAKLQGQQSVIRRLEEWIESQNQR